MEPHTVSQKIVISGQYVEHYNYENPYYVGYPRLRSNRLASRSRVRLQQEQIRDDNVRRTRTKIRRLVNCNQDLVKFMTLTFNISVKDLNEANPYFQNFVKKLRRRYKDFKYICVPEFQPKSQRVHYHLLCNIPYIDNNELTQLWGNGFTFIRMIDNVDNLGAYICKYLGKANFDTRYFKKQKFFYSLNLLKPIIIDDLEKVIHIINNLPTEIGIFLYRLTTFDFYTKYLGNIQYKQYKLAKFIKFTF